MFVKTLIQPDSTSRRVARKATALFHASNSSQDDRLRFYECDFVGPACDPSETIERWDIKKSSVVPGLVLNLSDIPGQSRSIDRNSTYSPSAREWARSRWSQLVYALATAGIRVTATVGWVVIPLIRPAWQRP